MKPFSLPRLAALMAAALAAGLAAPPAPAHVTLERTQAPADSYYKAVLQVSHGCKGLPTLAVRVRIPEGVLSVKPQPKPGWTLMTSARSMTSKYGASTSGGVSGLMQRPAAQPTSLIRLSVSRWLNSPSA